MINPVQVVLEVKFTVKCEGGKKSLSLCELQHCGSILVNECRVVNCRGTFWSFIILSLIRRKWNKHKHDSGEWAVKMA